MKTKNNVCWEAFGLIQKLLVLLVHFGPKTKRWFRRVWYNIFARKAYSHSFFFMNYGFSDENLFIEMAPKEEHERYPAQLYHHTANQECISEKKVLKVGSSRGGGASYISRYLKPKSVLGIDISKNAIKLCNSTHQYPNLSFCVGDSEKVPFVAMLDNQFPNAQFLITGFLGPGSNAHNPNGFLHVPYARKLTACISYVLGKFSF